MAGTLPAKRPLSDDDRDKVLLPVVSGIEELLFAPVNPFNDRPGFVAGAEPSTGLAKAVYGLTRLNCRIWASRPKTGYSQRVNQYNGEVCGPYLDGIGEDPTPGSVLPPFSGGQCPTRYFVTAKWKNRNTDGSLGLQQEQNVTSPLGRPGAIAGIERRGGPGAWQMVLTHGIDGLFTSGESVVRTASSTQPAFEELSIVSVARVDGGADNCGNPEAVVQPPATVTPGTPIVPTVTINLPGVGPITVNVDLGDDGRPVICAPDVGVCLEVNPDFGDDTSEGNPQPPPGDIGSPGPEDTAGGGSGDAEGEAPEGSVLVGLRLTLVTIPPEARLYAPGVYRGVCYVYMGVPGNLDHDPAGAMVRSEQFCYAEKDNLTSWLVSSNNGFVIDVTPYYRELE